jgi:hypothetical protein
MTEPASSRPALRILMVGAGRRAQNNFLPVLTYLSQNHRIEIVGINARTAERLLPVAERWGVRAVHSIQDVDLASVDAVAVSVPTAQNAPVLQSLASHGSHLSLIVDTPIAWNRRELGAIGPLIAKFRRVLVAEDYMNFPQFQLIRRAVQSGLIGDLRGVTLYNIGFLYHGLALIRSFCGFGYARTTWRRNTNSFGNIVGYKFKGGYEGIVIGPYRKHETGGITVIGSKGVLTDFPGDVGFAKPGERAIYPLNYHRDENGVITGISLDGAGDPFVLELPEIVAMAKMNFDDKSDLNLLRGCGLMQVFRALEDPENLNCHYGAQNAFYDSFASRLAGHNRLPVDPLAYFGSNAVNLLRKIS